MALIKCPECRKEISDQANECVHCGYPISKQPKCSGHYIRAVVLEQEVWKHIQEVISVVTRYEAYFRSEMEEKLHVRERKRFGYIRSGWHRQRSVSVNLIAFSFVPMRTMYRERLMTNALP